MTRRRPRPGRRRPALEALEARRLLAVSTWTGGGDGIRLSDANNWSEPPSPDEDNTLLFPAIVGNRSLVDDLEVLRASSIRFEDSYQIVEGFNGGDAELRLGAGGITLAGAGNLFVGLLVGDDALLNVVADTRINVPAGSELTLLDEFSGLTGPGNILKEGQGRYIYNPQPTEYGGTISVIGGTITIGVSIALPTTSGFSLGPNTVLEIGNQPSLSNLGGSGRIKLLGEDSLLRINTASFGTLGASIEGQGGIVKQGNGELTLSGLNVYTGTTTIEAGTLRLDEFSFFPPLPNGSRVVIAGADATLDLAGRDDVSVREVSGPGTLSLNGGTLTVSPGFSSFAQELVLPAAVVGSGRIVVRVPGAGTLQLNRDLSMEATLEVAFGRLFTPVDAPATVTINAPVAVTGSGELSVFSPSTTLIVGPLSGDGTLSSSGPRIIVRSTANAEFRGNLNGSFDLVKQRTGTQTLGLASPFGFNGRVVIEEGFLVDDSGPNQTLQLATIVAQRDVFRSNGRVAALAANNSGGGTAGTIIPGTAAATGFLEVAGAATLTPGGRLLVRLGGTAVGTGYDQLKVEGTLTPGGQLIVQLFNGFVPAFGATFVVAKAAAISGRFSNAPVNGSVINVSGLSFRVDHVFNAVDNTTEVTLTRLAASTTTTLAPIASPSVFGQAITLTATVTSAGGTPTGSVQFKDGATDLGTRTLTGGVATLSGLSLSVGTHALTATYLPATGFTASTSAALSQVVNKAATGVALVSSVNPSTPGAPVTFTATVTAPGGGTPTGSVQFRDEAVALGTPVALVGGVAATPAITSLSSGSHAITAEYLGSTNHLGSTSATLNQSVGTIATTTTVVASPSPSTFGQSVTFTATVAAASGTPGGSVVFKEGATVLATSPLNNGQASFSKADFAAGAHAITAEYAGAGGFGGSSRTLALTVNPAVTTVALAAAPGSTVFGQALVLTATAAPVAPGGGTPSGMVQFRDGATSLGSPVALAGGVATLSIATLSAGPHDLSAAYLGSTNHLNSTSAFLNRTINPAATSVTLAAAPGTIGLGQSVALTATLAAVAPGAGVPSGLVTFRDGATELGTAAPNAQGVATLPDARPLFAGNRALTATVAATTNFAASTSAGVTVAVAPPAPDLQAGSDSGTSTTDDLTNAATPAFVADGFEPGATVQLLRDGSVVATRTGSGPITDPGPAAEGARSYALRPAAGGPAGPVLPVVIDRTAPPSPAVALLADDDTGVKGDDRTSKRQPRFAGSTEPGATVVLLRPDGSTIATAATDAIGGAFVVGFPADLINGAYAVRTRVVDPAGNSGPAGPDRVIRIVTTAGDFTADGLADRATYRRSDGRWSIDGRPPVAFGGPQDIPLSADFDGDGQQDLAVFRPETGDWFIRFSAGVPMAIQFGAAGGGDQPVPADYDGDGRADLAVFRTSEARWFIRLSAGGSRDQQFGAVGNVDLPVPADYDGDGKADLAVFRTRSADWFILRSRDGPRAVQFGAANLDVPVPADFDADNQADLAVFRPDVAQWFVRHSGVGSQNVQFGQPNLDVPAPADYDRDGRADFAVFRPTTAQWLIRQSTAGPSIVPLGTPNDAPIVAPMRYRLPPAVASASAAAEGRAVADLQSPVVSTAIPAGPRRRGAFPARR